MSSEFIYASTKVLPYVYKLIHKETGQFYFGVRHANKVPSSEDLGIKYFSSSKYVKTIGFENFNYEILAEFFRKEDALEFESTLINTSWRQINSLNKNVGGKKFYNQSVTDTTREKIRNTRKNSKLPDDVKNKISKALTGRAKSANHCNSISLALRDVPKTDTAKHKMSLAKRGKPTARPNFKFSTESRNKMSNSQSLTYVLHDRNNNTETIITNLVQFCNANNLSINSLRNTLKHNRYNKSGLRISKIS